MTLQVLSQARAMRSALVNRLYCAVCAVFVGVLSTPNRNHHHFSDDVRCHELQLVCHCEVGRCEVEDEDEDDDDDDEDDDAAGGFPRGSL